MSYPIAHFLVPFLISKRIGLSKKFLILSGLMGILPDVDAAWLFHNYEWYDLLHRYATHGIFLGVLISLLLSLFLRAKSFKERVLIFVVGLSSYLSHLLLDYFFTTAGVAFFAPFNNTEFMGTIININPSYWFDAIIIVAFLIYYRKDIKVFFMKKINPANNKNL